MDFEPTNQESNPLTQQNKSRSRSDSDNEPERRSTKVHDDFEVTRIQDLKDFSMDDVIYVLPKMLFILFIVCGVVCNWKGYFEADLNNYNKNTLAVKKAYYHRTYWFFEFTSRWTYNIIFLFYIPYMGTNLKYKPTVEVVKHILFVWVFKQVTCWLFLWLLVTVSPSNGLFGLLKFVIYRNMFEFAAMLIPLKLTGIKIRFSRHWAFFTYLFLGNVANTVIVKMLEMLSLPTARMILILMPSCTGLLDSCCKKLIWRTCREHANYEFIVWMSGVCGGCVEMIRFACIVSLYYSGASTVEILTSWLMGVAEEIWVHSNVKISVTAYVSKKVSAWMYPDANDESAPTPAADEIEYLVSEEDIADIYVSMDRMMQYLPPTFFMFEILRNIYLRSPKDFCNLAAVCLKISCCGNFHVLITHSRDIYICIIYVIVELLQEPICLYLQMYVSGIYKKSVEQNTSLLTLILIVLTCANFWGIFFEGIAYTLAFHQYKNANQ